MESKVIRRTKATCKVSIDGDAQPCDTVMDKASYAFHPATMVLRWELRDSPVLLRACAHHQACRPYSWAAGNQSKIIYSSSSSFHAHCTCLVAGHAVLMCGFEGPNNLPSLDVGKIPTLGPRNSNAKCNRIPWYSIVARWDGARINERDLSGGGSALR